jgi:hypothetical protein
MNRYSSIPFFPTEPNEKRRYVTVKYPKIPLGPLDIYVYTTQGDRYDTLASSFYNDSSLWWVINIANPSQDAGSLFPTIGAQIRIPAPSLVSSIISQYENLNSSK